jgi:hypothetical protein
MRVCKKWNIPSKKLLYQTIRFQSVLQRQKFFDAIQQDFSIKSPKSSKEINGMPVVMIPRRSSLRMKKSTGNRDLIQSLDFGLRPRNVTTNEPPLPCTKPILQSPLRMSIDTNTLPSPTTTRITNINLNGDTFISSGIKRNSIPRLAKIVQVSTNSVSTNPLENSIVETRYGEWQDRFVSPFMPLVAQYLSHLKHLNICGCHLNAHDFSLALENLVRLESLDVSYSTLKSDGIESISRYCRHKLQKLNVSGIFKLGRNKPHTIILIAMFCSALKQIIALDCPEMYPETVTEAHAISNSRIEFIQ